MKTSRFIKIQTRLLAALSLVLITFVSCRMSPTPEKCKEWWPLDRIERITKVKIPDYEVTRFAYGPSGIDFVDTIFIEFESVPSDEMFEKIDECYREIISLAGKENVLFKGHPRSMEEPAIEMNRVTGSVPMEVFYSNMEDLEGKVLVAYNSTATYTPKLLFGKEPRVINLHRIVGGPMQQNSETLYRTFLPTYEDKGRLLAPETTEELRQMITDIMKEEKQP